MSFVYNGITLLNIKNVRKSGDEEGVYFADVEMSCSEGFPPEWNIYCARSDDYAPTGKWVYQQIIEGNFEGDITQLLPFADPVTGLVVQRSTQEPPVQGAQTL